METKLSKKVANSFPEVFGQNLSSSALVLNNPSRLELDWGERVLLLIQNHLAFNENNLAGFGYFNIERNRGGNRACGWFRKAQWKRLKYIELGSQFKT